jgi:hypothetical protein
LPDGADRFILRHIRTLEQLEILLLMMATPSRAWSAHELASELRTNAESASTRLAELSGDGLVEPMGGAPPRYRYKPASEELDRGARALERLYRERRVAVITQIFSPAGDSARHFADAFRIKKEGS